MKAKLVIGMWLWELMLITMEGDKNKQPATLQKNDLNIKYLWEQELSENYLNWAYSKDWNKRTVWNKRTGRKILNKR